MANILVFDVNSASRRLAAALLRNHGNCVRDVGDADEALRLVRLERPDLMIMDLATPDIDGCRLVVRMRCDPSLPQPRVLVRAVAGVEVEARSEEHTSELQSQSNLVCRLLLEKTKLLQYSLM